ncbi:molybdenum ABC transporter ATP-binding protein [Thioalkalivibrio sp.]|uniref:molybdenum ABC transporter ATP-binding protein n=1 Tax=Thioalkalivibrio sp. TaxID=2093813 RepID=UPI0035634A89
MTIELRLDLERPGFRLTIDTEVPGRGVTALFGRSGCGKTTLLRCVAGLERSVRGRLVVNGETWQDADRFTPAHQRPLGYVFQEGQLFPHLSVEGNLRYGYRRIPAAERVVQPEEVTRLLGLETLLQRRVTEISGGQRQRVAMGRALLTSPRVLLMDEPLAALDAISKAEILPYLERLHDELSVPVLYVSHAIDEVSRLADHMLFMEDGAVRAEGALRELITRRDLPLAHAEGAAAVIEARVTGHDDRHHLTELEFDGGKLVVSREHLQRSVRVRVRIMARDVAIHLTRPRDSSVLNCVPARVLDVSDDPHPGHVLVRLAVGDSTLLSRITRRSLAHLALQPGTDVYALVKSVAIT